MFDDVTFGSFSCLIFGRFGVELRSIYFGLCLLATEEITGIQGAGRVVDMIWNAHEIAFQLWILMIHCQDQLFDVHMNKQCFPTW